MASSCNFDLLARPYRALELLAFGHALERARFRYLDRLAGCRDILVLGEGDGRCMERLLALAPDARIRCIDASTAMIERATARLAQPAEAPRRRVIFEQSDALTASYPPGAYDAVVTFFFLDCFRPEQVSALASALGPSLRPRALWLFADFILPARGWRRLRGRLTVTLLYAFFRWVTGLPASALPPAEEIIQKAGFALVEAGEFSAGLVRSAVFRKVTACS